MVFCKILPGGPGGGGGGGGPLPTNLNTVDVKSLNVSSILYCKRPILWVGAWPIWVGPTHSTFDQPALYTSSSTHSKMSDFQ